MPAPRLATIATLLVVSFRENHESVFPIEIRSINLVFFLVLLFLFWILAHKKPCPEDTGQGYVMLLGITTP